MLSKSHIAKFDAYTPEWHQHRNGKFTSSKISVFAGDGNFTKGALTYIYHKVGEEITGMSIDKEFEFDEDIDWGNKYEPDMIARFSEVKKVEFLAVQKLISHPNTRFASTPDAIWVHGQSILNENQYNVSTLEGKCPRTFHKFIELSLCKKPLDLKKANPVYFWQTIDQMSMCDSAIGYFAAYHPYFPKESNINIIEFRKMELWEEFKLLESRKNLAVKKFEEVRFSLIGI
jgi:hypothetical protein